MSSPDLEGRDPDWTCIIDGDDIGGDIYIHRADTVLGVSMGTMVFALFGALIAVLLVVDRDLGHHRPEAKARGSWSGA